MSEIKMMNLEQRGCLKQAKGTGALACLHLQLSVSWYKDIQHTWISHGRSLFNERMSKYFQVIDTSDALSSLCVRMGLSVETGLKHQKSSLFQKPLTPLVVQP